MRRPVIAVCGGIVLLAVGVLCAVTTTAVPPPQVLLRDFVGEAGHLRLVSAAAHTQGLEGTTWLTDLELHNPGHTRVSGYLFFLWTGRDNSNAVGSPFSVEPGTSLRLVDVVQSAFGETRATGAILIGADAGLMVTSRTYNDDESGTYGQYVEGYADTEALATGEEARLIQLVENTAARTNLGIVNVGPAGLYTDVDFYRGNGARLGSRRYWVGPFMHIQDVRVLASVTTGDVDDGYAVVATSTPGARLFAYASVTDNRTGDPTLVVPASVSSGTPVYLPGAAHVDGYGGTAWRTDLEVHNPGSTQARFTVELLARDAANTAPAQQSFSLDGGRSVRFVDVLTALFQRAGAGAATLRISPTEGQLVAIQRTYNDQPTGTYGQFMAGVPEDDAVAYGQTACIVQLSQSASDATGFRTNLGLVNATGAAIMITVDLYRADGVLLGSRSYQLPAYGYRQEDRIFLRVTTDAVADGYALLWTTTPAGRFFAYASVVDNRSGDPIAIPARLPGPPPCSYAIDPEGRSHGAGAEIGSFTISAPVDCAWAPTSSASWLQLTAGMSGSGDGIVSYRLDANPGAAARTAAIEVPGVPPVGPFLEGGPDAVFTVTQAGQSCTYTLTPTNRSHGAGAETGSFTVAAPDGCAWLATSTAAWIQVTSPASGSGDGAVSYRLDANPRTTPRTGTILVHGEPFTISQEGLSCSYALNPTGRDHGAGAETGSFAVTAPAGCTWAAIPTAAWIQVTSLASGSGDGTVSYRLDANPHTWLRTGTIMVHGVPFTITQEALSCSYTLTPAGRTHGAGAETGSFAVTAPSGCPWAANATAAWIQVTGGASGSGNGTVAYRLEANTGSSARTGSILVHGEPFTVTQEGQACSYTLTPTGRAHGAEAETGSFSVTAPAGCTWTANATTSWIQVTGGSSGSGNGTVSYSLGVNTGVSARTGTIVVHGAVFTITQEQGAEITVMLPGGVPLTVVRIPAGSFQMGSPATERGRFDDETEHQVTLTQDYYIGEYEVTQRQWAAVMGSNPSYFTGCGLDCPVESVSWNEVCGGTTGADCAPASFIGRLNAYLGTTKFRLPTEAEWEYAARAGTTTEFSFSAPSGWDVECGSFPAAEGYMWWCGNAGGTTHPAGRKGANPWGLYDVHGNVYEWVADWYGTYPSWPVTDPTGPSSGSARVERGGSYSDHASRSRSAFRHMYDPPSTQWTDTGFRLARTP